MGYAWRFIVFWEGLLKIVYKDAIEYEFNNKKIQYQREKKYAVEYKDIILPHCFYADFVVFDKIILEVKSRKGIVDEHYGWVINFVGISKCPLGLTVNFGENSLVTKRVIFIICESVAIYFVNLWQNLLNNV